MSDDEGGRINQHFDGRLLFYYYFIIIVVLQTRDPAERSNVEAAASVVIFKLVSLVFLS